MSGKSSSTSGSTSNSSSGSATGGGYEVTSSGTNSQVGDEGDSVRAVYSQAAQGNHYDARDYGSSASNSNSYHYSNTDGSYYYSNPDGSTYHNDGAGNSNYTAPGGKK
ncbi:hypothetical protein LTR10_012504 [Elasticomyces elasticus]|nr:hypothetical protein LTR10_012504 [Elasticomyces elasticus]KAK4965978.1 hypothetical protein LTR42_011992 [Elasticomyces elasticus]